MNPYFTGRGFKHRACRQCGGDGFFDGSEDSGRCLQCGRRIALADAPTAAASGVVASLVAVPSSRNAAKTWITRHRERRRASKTTSPAVMTEQRRNF
jgi:hypothetical protein